MCRYRVGGVGFDRPDAYPNILLISAAEQVLAFDVRKRSVVTLDDTCIVRPAEIVAHWTPSAGFVRLLTKSINVLTAPRKMLTARRDAVGSVFSKGRSNRMCPRARGGVWVLPGYDVGEQSAEFATPFPSDPPPTLADDLLPIAEAAKPQYESMAGWRQVTTD